MQFNSHCASDRLYIVYLCLANERTKSDQRTTKKKKRKKKKKDEDDGECECGISTKQKKGKEGIK